MVMVMVCVHVGDVAFLRPISGRDMNARARLVPEYYLRAAEFSREFQQSLPKLVGHAGAEEGLLENQLQS